jgi:prepilin-type N-terminal cleavage/methylation domain-containing protein
MAQSTEASEISALLTGAYTRSDGRQIKSVFTTNKKQKGFTLIEILLVMLITSVLVLGVNAAFRQAHMLWSRAEEQRPVYQKTRLFFDTLTEELVCLYIPKIGDDQQQPAPFDLSALPDGTVRLSFLTMNPVWKDTSVSNFPSKIIYEFTTDSDSGRRVLSRTERLFSGEKAVSPQQKETILEGFSGVTIQAADADAGAMGDSWKADLQCSQRPPKAVKILLKWPKDEQTEYEFETIIEIASEGQINLP